MTQRFLVKWVLVNALGLAIAFVTALQTEMFVQFGFNTQLHWQFIPPEGGVGYAFAELIFLIVLGAIFGAVQTLILRGYSVRVIPWIVLSTAGFGVVACVSWPLIAANLWGKIPGPVEPIVTFVIGGGMAGILQFLWLRRQGILAQRWVVLWVGGVILSLVPTAALFMSLESLGVSVGWPMEAFLNGLVVGGVAALASGKALFAALTGVAGSEADVAE